MDMDVTITGEHAANGPKTRTGGLALQTTIPTLATPHYECQRTWCPFEHNETELWRHTITMISSSDPDGNFTKDATECL
jgi:hypothetical protein